MFISKFRLAWVLYLLGIFSSLQLWAESLPQEVHLSFQERVFATYALASVQKSEVEKVALYKRAAQYFEKISYQPSVIQTVANFKEFLSSFRGEWPNSGNLDIDLQKIESQAAKGLVRYSSPSARVQKRIDEYLKNHFNYFKKLTTVGLSEVKSVPFEKLHLIFSQTTEKYLSEFDSIGTKAVASAFDLVPDPLDRIRLRILFDQYYAQQSIDSKKQFISEVLGQKMNLTEAEKFEIMIQNSGPQFQKFLQIVIRQKGIPSEIKKRFQVLENNVKAVPWWQVEEILKTEQGNFDFTYFEKKPLGVGTMAQVHRAKILVEGIREDVVVRFIKPGIAQRVEEDTLVLAKVAAAVDSDPEYRRLNGPRMTPFMEDISQTVRSELNIKATISRQIYAKKVYDILSIIKTPAFKGEIQFYVPKIFSANLNSQLMVQEMALGRSLDKEAAFYFGSPSDFKKAFFEEFSRLWVREVIFGSGFYHADLHQGNFLVRIAEPNIRSTILDFGMGGFIDKETQNLLIFLGIALHMKKADLIAEAYWKVSEQTKNQLNRKEFSQKVEERLKELNQKKISGSIFEWTGWATNEGLRLPYNFINLNRGILIINKSLEEAGSDLGFESIAKSLALKNPNKVLEVLKSNPQLKWPDLIKLGWRSEPTKIADVRCELVFSR